MAKRPFIDMDSGSLWPGAALTDWVTDPREAFKHWLAGEVVAHARQFRDTSIATYTYHFSAWIHFLETNKSSLLEATSADAASFFAAQALEPVSRRRYLQLLDRVYRSLKVLGWSGANPMIGELAKERALEPPAPASLSDSDAAAVWSAVTVLDDWKGVRDRAMLALLLGAGLRANEVIALPWSAVGRDYTVHIKPSGVHREHTSLILPGPGREYWDTWEAEKTNLGVISDVAFPAVRTGRPYSESGLFRRIDTWLRLAGVKQEDNRGANLLRNTFARQALTRYSPEEVKEFLGHEELRATVRHGPEDLRSLEDL